MATLFAADMDVARVFVSRLLRGGCFSEINIAVTFFLNAEGLAVAPLVPFAFQTKPGSVRSAI